MKYLGFVFVVCLMFSTIRAEDVKLKDGRIYKNVSLADSSEQYYVFKSYPQGKTMVSRDNIQEIIWTPADPTKKTAIIGAENYLPEIPKTLYIIKKYTEDPDDDNSSNIIDSSNVIPKFKKGSVIGKVNIAGAILPLSLAVTYFGIKSLSDGSDLPPGDGRDRNTIAGVICLLGGALATIASFSDFEIKADYNSINIKYRF